MFRRRLQLTNIDYRHNRGAGKFAVNVAVPSHVSVPTGPVICAVLGELFVISTSEVLVHPFLVTVQR